jgi:hypothetical protein
MARSHTLRTLGMPAPFAIFCADPLDPRSIEPNFADEARAAREAGFTVAKLDHDYLDRQIDPGRALRAARADRRPNSSETSLRASPASSRSPISGGTIRVAGRCLKSATQKLRPSCPLLACMTAARQWLVDTTFQDLCSSRFSEHRSVSPWTRARAYWHAHGNSAAWPPGTLEIAILGWIH